MTLRNHALIFTGNLAKASPFPRRVLRADALAAGIRYSGERMICELAIYFQSSVRNVCAGRPSLLKRFAHGALLLQA